jgi:hypothetical protein
MPSLRPHLRRPPAAMVVALLALFVALGGPAQAAKLINGARIKAGTVGSKQVKDRSLKLRDFSRGAARSLTATPGGSVGPLQLADNAVTTRALAPGSVTTGTVGDNSLTSADLASNAVGSDEVADNAVGQSEIRTNGVSASEIADNSIDGGEIVDGGLSVRDVARHVGTLNWPIKPLLAGTCDQPVRVTIAGIQVAGDFVVISPVTAWPAGLVYAVNGTAAEDGFKVQVCNRGSQPAPDVETTYTFNYAIFGF